MICRHWIRNQDTEDGPIAVVTDPIYIFRNPICTNKQARPSQRSPRLPSVTVGNYIGSLQLSTLSENPRSCCHMPQPLMSRLKPDVWTHVSRSMLQSQRPHRAPQLPRLPHQPTSWATLSTASLGCTRTCSGSRRWTPARTPAEQCCRSLPRLEWLEQTSTARPKVMPSASHDGVSSVQRVSRRNATAKSWR